jgi:hypothetical protein
MNASTIVSHRVTFLSPGTFFAEQTSKPVESWDVKAAAGLSSDVVERYGAKPYAFYFTTSITAPDVPDGMGGFLKVEPRETERSGLHFLGGTVLTLADVEARNDPKDSILISNMRCNRCVVVENTNSYKSVNPFGENDVIVDGAGDVTVRGDAPEYVAVRAA